MKRCIYIIPLLLLAFVSCRDFHVNFVGDTVLAEVDGKSLLQSELSSAIPNTYKGKDSISFAEVFIDKWIHKQVKLREAERIFLTSEADIERLVEEYRQLLLTKKLDERFVNASIDTTYTDKEISQYYTNHASNFRLTRDIVKCEVVRIPLESDQTKKVKELMASLSETKRTDMISICEKNDFAFHDLSASWVEASKFLDLLPLVRSEESDKILAKRGINHMSDSNYDYYYQIFENKKIGNVAPLEWVKSTIRTILITERQQEIIRSNEKELFEKAIVDGVIKEQYKERQERERRKEEELKEENNEYKNKQ